MLQKFPEFAGIAKVTQVQFIDEIVKVQNMMVRRSRYTANDTQVRRSQEVSQYPAERRCRSGFLQEQPAVRLSQQPTDEDEISQNSTACVDGHRAAVQEKDTAHVKHLTYGAKRDMKLKYRTVVLEIISRLPRRDSITQWGGRPQLTMPWQSSADQTEKKHTDIFS